jgi:hypothetical protein
MLLQCVEGEDEVSPKVWELKGTCSPNSQWYYAITWMNFN